MNNWTCPKCKKPYVLPRKEWRERGHCAVCEVASWTPEKLAETEGAFAHARPAILHALRDDEPEHRINAAGDQS